MNKKILAVLIATLPVSAMADVIVYGSIKLGVDSSSKGSAGSVNRLNDNGSRLGFKGSEDLGNGLKAIWQVESRLSADGDQTVANRNTFSTRDTFIGLSNEVGTVRLGRLSNFGNSDMEWPDTWTYDAKYSPNLGLVAFTRADTRYNNAVRVDSNNLPVKLSAIYSSAESSSQQNRLALGMSYKIDAFALAYTYGKDNNAINNNRDGGFQRIEASYTVGNAFVAAGYGMTKTAASVASGKLTTPFGQTVTVTNVANGSEVVAKDFALTANYKLGNIVAKATFAKGGNVKADGKKIDKSGYKQYIVGADYVLSKTTKAGLSYGQLNYNTSENQDIKGFGLQVSHSF